MTGESRWDALAKDLAGGRMSRRTALKRAIGGAAAVAVPSALMPASALAHCPPSRECGSKCCPSGMRCKRGKCKCKSGLKKCGSKCRDVATDPLNCGACGHVCASGQTCVGGQCTSAPGCTTAADCPQSPAGGCQQAVCVTGNCGFAPDNTNVPADDGNPCTTSVCANGAPAQTQAAAGTACGSGLVCNDSGSCVG